MDDNWHHICLVWHGAASSGFTRYYRDGTEVKSQTCPTGPRTNGHKLHLGGGGRTETVELTIFYLWNRMLTEYDIADEAKTCDGGMGGPVARWRDFYVAVKRDRSLRSYVRTTSQCPHFAEGT